MHFVNIRLHERPITELAGCRAVNARRREFCKAALAAAGYSIYPDV